MRVFLVEDSPLLREELRGALSGMDDVEIAGEADNVQDAEQGVLRSRPHVVILDIRLAGGSGIDVLRTIKKKLPEVKVIVMTNYPLFQYRVMCMARGADYFLDKHKEYSHIPEILGRLRWAENRPGLRNEEDPS
ncbi:MAG: response regulator transcription factor [Nitrospinae bacterium]|nr:response regulator transcription factor [Nitrospinota bacterium]